MTPRLKTSKKWTAFPTDFIDQVRDNTNEIFGAKIKDAELIIEGRIYPSEICVRLGYLRKGNLKQNNFEVSVDYKQDKAMDQILTALEAAATLMDDFLDNEDDSELPRTWKEFEFEGENGNHKIHFQYSTVNTKLEDEANRLLGEDDSGMLKGSDEEDGDPVDPDVPPSDKNKLH